MNVLKYILRSLLILTLFCGFKFYDSHIIKSLVSYGSFNYVDSLSISNSGNYAITYVFNDSIMDYKVNFFKRNRNGWDLIQTIDSLENMAGVINAKFKDFNNDNVRDFMLYKGTGARGANEFYYVFLVDTLNNQLVRIKNGDDIPNIDYNDKISGIFYSGGTSYVNYKLQKDSLVETDGESEVPDSIYIIRTKYKIDSNGTMITLSKDTVIDNEQGF